MRTITVQELDEIRRRGDVPLIDVRTPAEFRAVHVEGARNVPLGSIGPEVGLAGQNGSGATTYLICQSGSRGGMACRQLIDAGCVNVVNVEGGTRAWEEAGLPVVRGKKTISLERQVRIAAGSLVVIASVLGYLVHPDFIALAAVVGAGLVYSGVTDTCGMGMLLARMPWNQVSADDSCRNAQCAA